MGIRSCRSVYLKSGANRIIGAISADGFHPERMRRTTIVLVAQLA